MKVANPDMSDCTGSAYVVSILEWVTARRLNAPLDSAICAAHGCDGWLRPVGDPPGQNARRYFLEAVCEKCHVSYGWPQGRTQLWFEELARRRRGEGRRAVSSAPGGFVPPPEAPPVDEPSLLPAGPI